MNSTTGHVTVPSTSFGFVGAQNVNSLLIKVNKTFSSTRNASSAGEHPEGSRSQAYIYGTLAVLIVSLLSLTGAAILPVLNKKLIYRCSILTFMALAVGTMTADAFLHMIPECLGLHSHSDHGHEKEDAHHDHGHDEDHEDGSGHHHHGHDHDHDHDGKKDYIMLMSVLIVSIYALYLLETVSITFAKYFKFSHSHGAHTHFGHGGIHANLESNGGGGGAVELKPSVSTTSSSSGGAVGAAANGSASSGGTANKRGGASPASHRPGATSQHQPPQLICGLKPVAFVIIFGDGLHNFCDGLAIGAAFMGSVSSGISTTIAVICHELPHEVGDFAILLNSNMSVKRALLFNFLSALTAFLGLYVGIEAGQLESARKWIFALVAGGFLYISLVHMLNEIKECSENLRWSLAFALQNVGFMCGFAVVLLLALYE